MGGVALGDTLVDGSAADCGAEGEACLGAEVLEAGFGEAALQLNCRLRNC